MFYITSISLQLQHWCCNNTSALLSVNLLKYLSNRSSHVAAITSHISLFIQKLQWNQCKKTHYIILSLQEAHCGSRSLCCSFTPNSFFSHTQQRFSHSQRREVRTHKTRVPNIPFHCAFLLWKSLTNFAKISPHNLGRAFHSPGGLTTVTTLSGSVRCLTWTLLVSREAEGGKAKVCPALVLQFSVFEAVPLTESLQPLKPPARSQWETFCMPGWATK